MDAQQFDGIARILASGSSRRSVLRGLVGGALAAVGLNRASQAADEKVPVCHLTDAATNSWVLINISDAAYPTHLAHGDGDYNSTAHCGACGHACSAPANATATCSEGTCGFTCNEGYEPDGAGGCARILNPAINISFDSTGTTQCLIQVDLVDFAANTTYPLIVQLAASSTGPAFRTFDSSLTTDGNGFASGYPIGSFVNTAWVRVSSNGITTDWHDLVC